MEGVGPQLISELSQNLRVPVWRRTRNGLQRRHWRHNAALQKTRLALEKHNDSLVTNELKTQTRVTKQEKLIKEQAMKMVCSFFMTLKRK